MLALIYVKGKVGVYGNMTYYYLFRIRKDLEKLFKII